MSGDKLRSPHVSWVFAQLVTFPIFGRGGNLGWPSQSRLRRASSPEGGAKSRLPLWGRWHAKGMTERATCPRRARALAVRTGAAFSRQSRLPARSVLNGPHWGPGPPGRELPGVQPPRIESPGTGPLRSAPGADVRHSLAQARRSAAAPWRELSRAVTHREMRAQALGRPGKTLRCFPSFLSCAARL